MSNEIKEPDESKFELVDENGQKLDLELEDFDKGMGLEEREETPDYSEDPNKKHFEEMQKLDENESGNQVPGNDTTPDPRDEQIRRMEQQMTEMRNEFNKNKFEAEKNAEVSKIDSEIKKEDARLTEIIQNKIKASRVKPDDPNFAKAQDFLARAEVEIVKIQSNMGAMNQKLEEAKGKEYTPDNGIDVSSGQVPPAAKAFIEANAWTHSPKTPREQEAAKKAAELESFYLKQGLKPDSNLYSMVEQALKGAGYTDISWGSVKKDSNSGLLSDGISHIMGGNDTNTGAGPRSPQNGQPTARRGSQNPNKVQRVMTKEDRALLNMAQKELGSDFIDSKFADTFLKQNAQDGKKVTR